MATSAQFQVEGKEIVQIEAMGAMKLISSLKLLDRLNRVRYLINKPARRSESQ